MKSLGFLGAMVAAAAMVWPSAPGRPVSPDTGALEKDYKVLAPISRGNLTIFPVVSAKTHDTSAFLTLDEGIRSGEVVVTEVGKMHPMVRRPVPLPPPSSAEVNRLVLVNNSKRPLILLAGEVVTGGKQDRIVAKDRMVPAESDPVDLSVFCVEHGRWTEASTTFGTPKASMNFMAQPSVRKRAMADNSQSAVWAEVGKANDAVALKLSQAAPAKPAAEGAEYSRAQVQVQATTSYAKVRENGVVQKELQSVVDPIDRSFETVIKQLRDQNAVGVVVAVKGRIIWADMFASSTLLGKYWPKLLPSYAAEAYAVSGGQGEVSTQAAQEFLNNWQARHETVETEPGLFKQTEMIGDRFKAFTLTSLLPKQAFDIHVSKMAE